MIVKNSKDYNLTISPNEIDHFIQTLMAYLFPGFFEKVKGTPSDYFQMKLFEAKVQLKNLLTKVNAETGVDELFFESLEGVSKTLLTDIDAMYEGDPAAESKEEIILTYPGFYAILIYRLAHVLYLNKVALLPRMMSENAHSRTGIDIHPGATIGDYFFIDHGTGIVVGETTTIGKHVKLYQGVTLGALSLAAGQNLRGKKRHPTIGSYVTIYSGASILGGDTTIGDHVTIGSNVFLTESVESNCKVLIKKPELIQISKESK
jgi:serine O-acetyltransferase